MAKSTDHFLVSLFREAGDPLAADRLIDFEQMYAGPDRFHPTHNIQSVADSEDAGDGAGGDPMAGAGVSMPGGAGGMPPMGDPGLGAPGGQPPGDDQLTDMNMVGGDPNQQQPPPVQEARVDERNQFWGGMAPRGVMGGPHMMGAGFGGMMGAGFGGMMPQMMQPRNPYMQQQNPYMQPQQQQQPTYPRLPPVQPRSVPGVAPVTTPNPNDPAQVPQRATGSTLPGVLTDEQFRRLPADMQQAIAPNYKPTGMVTNLITRSSTEGGSDLQKKIDAEKAGGAPAAGAAGAPAAALPAVPAGEKGLTAEKPPAGSHDLWGQPAASAGHQTLAGRMFRAIPDGYTDLSNMVTGNTANAATLPKGQAVGNAASALNGAPAANVAAPPNNTQSVVGDAGKQKMGEAMYDDIDEFLEEMLRIDEAPPYGAYAGTGGYGGPYPGGARPPGGAYYGGRMGPPGGGMGGDPRMGGGGPQPYMGPAGGMMRARGPIDYQGMRFGGPGQGGPSVAPQNYGGFNGPQAPPPSVQAGGPGAIRNWQQQMSAIGGGAAAGAAQGGGAPTRGSRAGGNRPAAAAPAAAPARNNGPYGANGTPDRVADARATNGANNPAQGGGGALNAIGNMASAGAGAGVGAGFARNAGAVGNASNSIGTSGRAGALAGGNAAGGGNRVPAFQGGRASQLVGDGTAAAAGSVPNSSTVGRQLGNTRLADVGQVGRAGLPAFQTGRAGQLMGGNAGGGVQTPPGPSQPGAAGVGRAAQLAAGNAGGPPPTGGPTQPGAAGVGRNAAIMGGNAGPAAAAPAAAGAEGGFFSRAANAIGSGAGTAARWAGRLAAPVAGIAGAGEDYAQHGSIPHALMHGVGTGVGSLVGGAAGGAVGAGLGTLAAPGVGTTIGGITGGALGGYKGAQKGGQAMDWVSDHLGMGGNPAPAPHPAAAPTPPPAPAAAPAGATGNMVSGLPKPTAPTPPPTQTAAKLESVNWKMNWNDYCVLTESDKSREKKARGY